MTAATRRAGAGNGARPTPAWNRRVDHDERAVECRNVRRPCTRGCGRARASSCPRARACTPPTPGTGTGGRRDLVRVRDLGDHSLDVPLADAGLVEVAQVPHERHHAHRRDDRLPRLGVHAARQPARQPLPREPASASASDPLAQRRAPRVDCDRVELRGGSQDRQACCVGVRVLVVTAVEQLLEQRRLRVVAWRRVDELDARRPCGSDASGRRSAAPRAPCRGAAPRRRRRA